MEKRRRRRRMKGLTSIWLLPKAGSSMRYDLGQPSLYELTLVPHSKKEPLDFQNQRFASWWC